MVIKNGITEILEQHSSSGANGVDSGIGTVALSLLYTRDSREKALDFDA